MQTRIKKKKSRLTGKTRGRFTVLLISSHAAFFALCLSCLDQTSMHIWSYVIVLFDLKPLN